MDCYSAEMWKNIKNHILFFVDESLSLIFARDYIEWESETPKWLFLNLPY